MNNKVSFIICISDLFDIYFRKNDEIKVTLFLIISMEYKKWRQLEFYSTNTRKFDELYDSIIIIVLVIVS